jgi:hypothetical protein
MKVRRLLVGLARGRGSDLSALADHPLLPLVFDESWYLAKYPDVLLAGVNGAEHFLASGALEWRNPAPHVDLRFFAEALPAILRDGGTAFRHLLDVGIEQGLPTSAFVDLRWVAREQGHPKARPREVLARLSEDLRARRYDPSPWLDLSWYATEHPEIHLGGLDPFEYFLIAGRWLGRYPHPLWDEARYLSTNEYVRTAMSSGKYSSGFEQFCAIGWSEVVREPMVLPIRIAGREDEFSESRYLAANPDVNSLVTAGDFTSGLEHLMRIGHRDIVTGRRALRQPSPLATARDRTTARGPSGRILVLLNHFDMDDLVDPHVRVALETYRTLEADVVLVTTSPRVEGIDDLVMRIVTKSRNDDLRDFGGWLHALRALGSQTLEGYERIILTNDSVYFPVQDPSDFIARMLASKADVFGATDSLAGGRYHLQSYFLALTPSALSVLIPELELRAADQAEASKQTLIQRFEVGLSEYLIGCALRVEVYYPMSDIEDLATAFGRVTGYPLSRSASTLLNSTHHFWRSSLRAGLPFLKVELLRDNPVAVDIEGWQSAVTGPCTAKTIEEHLARVRR